MAISIRAIRNVIRYRKFKSIKKSSKNVTLYVFRDPRINRTKVSLFINVENKNSRVVLKDFEPKSLDINKSYEEAVSNKKGIRKEKFESELTFKYIKNTSGVKRTGYFEYLLPGVNHNVIVNTPYKEKLVVNFKD